MSGCRDRWCIMQIREAARGSGILLAISSLPSNYGIGTLGDAAYKFVDLLVDLKQKYWQILPLNPTGFGDSPYQSFSAFAGNPYLIDLDELVDEHLLLPEEIRGYYWGNNKSEVDYAALFDNRYQILEKAFGRFDEQEHGFQEFLEKNKDWIEDYSLYMALKKANKYRCWTEWPEEIRKKQPVALANCRKTLYNDIRFWGFCQYKFYEQWSKLREYARFKGISLIGELPFYVGEDSVDVWMHPEWFLLDEDGKAACVAAAVPDRHSRKGQKWGLPLYDWMAMGEDDFSWWRKRIQKSTEMYDIIRMNHFSGFVKNFAVPRKAAGAAAGKWIKGPGRKLVDAVNQELGSVPVIADDYGGKTLVPGVKKLLGKTGWYATKVLMFAFGDDPANEHLPHNYENRRMAVYAGTHDNETVAGYFRERTDYEMAYLYAYLDIDKQEDIPDALIRCAYASTADVVVIQMQDILKLGNEARMNVPATVGENWRWRLSSEQLPEERRAWLRNLAAVYRR